MDHSYGAVVYRLVDSVPQFLLVHHANGGHWDIPKGHPDSGETPKATAIREVREETGYQVTLEEDFCESIEYVLPRGESKQVQFYLGKIAGGPSGRADPGEILDMVWLDLESAIQKLTYDNSREVLLAADRYLQAA